MFQTCRMFLSMFEVNGEMLKNLLIINFNEYIFKELDEWICKKQQCN